MKRAVMVCRITSLSFLFLQIVIVALAFSPVGDVWGRTGLQAAQLFSKLLWAGFLVSAILGACLQEKDKKLKQKSKKRKKK